jgi:hypothetical protein
MPDAAIVSLCGARQSLPGTIVLLGEVDGRLGEANGRLADANHITRVKTRPLRDANGVPRVAKRRYEVKKRRYEGTEWPPVRVERCSQGSERGNEVRKRRYEDSEWRFAGKNSLPARRKRSPELVVRRSQVIQTGVTRAA